MSKQSFIQIITLVIIICFTSFSILSGFAILSYADHEHDNGGINESCFYCTVISNAKSLLDMLVRNSAGMSFLLLNLFGASALLYYSEYMFSAVSLVELRIKNSN